MNKMVDETAIDNISNTRVRGSSNGIGGANCRRDDRVDHDPDSEGLRHDPRRYSVAYATLLVANYIDLLS